MDMGLNASRRFICLISLLAAMASIGALALDPARGISQYPHEIWSAENGLPQNTVQALMQCRLGYLWLGCQEGLVRFDGVAFAVYDSTNTPAIKNNDIKALLEDRGGAIWCGTNGGGLLCLFGGKFKSFTRRDGLLSDIVLSLAEDGAGNLWVGTDSGLNMIRGGAISSFTERQGLARGNVRVLRVDPSGELWIGATGGLCRFRGGRFERFGLEHGLANLEVQAIYCDSSGSIWIGTRGGLFYFSGGRFLPLDTNDRLPSEIIWTICEDRQKSLWVGTSAGLCRMRDGRVETYNADDGLSYDIVWSIIEDGEGSLWVGTSSGGLNRFKDGKFVTYGKREGLSADHVWCVIEGRDGGMWIGTDVGGLNLFKDGKFKTYRTKDGLCYDEVGSLCEDSRGALWVGTPRGLSVLRGGRFKTFLGKDGLPNEWIRAIIEDRGGSIWIGTHGGGLARYKDGRFTTISTRDGLSSDFVRCIFEDRDGALWVGTNGGGLNRIADGKITVFTTKSGLPSDYIYCLHQDPEGSLWVGSMGGGICRLKGGKFKTCTSRDGLFNDLVFRILEDAAGTLWMSCNKGVFSVLRKDVDSFLDGGSKGIMCLAFGKSDGLRSSECNGGLQPAGWKGRDGRLWFATLKGVCMVDPSRMVLNQTPPPVVLEDILADGVRQGQTGGRAVIAPGTKEIEFHYAALSLLSPSRVHFRYRLSGFKQGWWEAGNRRIAYFTNLPPGDYTFQVTACNNDGVWNESGATYAFRLKPRFVQTKSFLALCCIALSAIVYAGWKLRVHRLKAGQEALEKLVEERTRQLNEANCELQRLAHADGLTGIANYRSFQLFLEREWRSAVRRGSPISLLMVDLDFFKPYNDAYGHTEGDECLCRVASVLSLNAKRPGDLAARYGGEEFAVVLGDTDAAGALQLAEAVRVAVEELSIRHEFSEAGDRVTISLGVASGIPREGGVAESLVKAADRALYESKRGGRNRVTAAELR